MTAAVPNPADLTMTPPPDPTTLPHWGDRWLETTGWRPEEPLQGQFQRLYDGILAGNQRLNLTRIVAPEEFWEKHLWDSLRGLFAPPMEPWRSRSATLLDIGTGGGFPGLPIALVQPQWSVTLLDSTRKKIRFVAELAADLGLMNTTAIAERAEQFARRPGGPPPSFDLITLRAVAPATQCAYYALPLLKDGGIAILYRGRWTDEEAAALEPVLAELGGELVHIEAFQTPLTQGERHCLYVRRRPLAEAF
ncbi:MAG: 16S rRNA (guanine(527)-N(7))-methyltransferase RsmG [Cyanobacteria bacterium]|nr:16S rRNA (guanine(527)-N(7))-methyltransferase RsmG [Cyanobacteriota bacterium]